MRGQVPGGCGLRAGGRRLSSLVARVKRARPRRRTSTPSARAVDELDAVRDCRRWGRSTNSLVAVHPLARRGLVGCVFHEVFGVEKEPLERRVADMPRVVEDAVGEWPSPGLAYSPTPHTLYTTHRDVVRRLLRAARDRGHRTSVHLCEHAAERRFLTSGDGPVADWYATRLKLRRDLLEWPGLLSVAFADELGALAQNVLAVHLTDARPEELDLVARRDASVVLCPRSTSSSRRRLPPLLAVLAAGIAAALGSDSRACNAALEVGMGARALADRFPSVAPAVLLRMATWRRRAARWGAGTSGEIARGEPAPASSSSRAMWAPTPPPSS